MTNPAECCKVEVWSPHKNDEKRPSPCPSEKTPIPHVPVMSDHVVERNYSVLSNYTSSLVGTQSTLQAAHLSYLMKLIVSAPEPERCQIENRVLI